MGGIHIVVRSFIIFLYNRLDKVQTVALVLEVLGS